MSLRRFVSLLVVLFTLFAARIARAEAPDVRGFFEAGTGVRTIDPRGLDLRAATADENASMSMRGSDMRPTAVGTVLMGGGVGIGRFVVGAEIGLGLGGGAGTKEQAAGDIEVRPSGFVAMASIGTFAGVIIDTKLVRLRFDGVLTDEIVGYSMERVGSPETRVVAVNAER